MTFAVITIVTNFAISDGWNVAPPTPSHLLAPLASIPNGVKTNAKHITVNIQSGNEFFFQKV